MKCGLCLPLCPTYAQTRNEADSPRGRISLVQGWLSGDLEMSARLTAHLDGCLTCRACERGCPSLVAFGRIMDGAKTRRIAESRPERRLLHRIWISALSDPRLNATLGRLAKIYARSPLASLARWLRLDRLATLGPLLRLSGAIAATAEPARPRPLGQADMDLFIGCSGETAQGHVIASTLELCERLGVRVNLPARHACCGAMLHHNGLPEEAKAHRDAVARGRAERPLVGISSACVAELKESPELADTQEICEYLDRLQWPESLQLRPLRARVLVHEPCSHRNLLGGNAAVHRLLARIPELDVEPMPENHRCCGAAGTYLLQQPEMSERLLADKLESALAAAPDIMVTTNSGCALHLLAGVQEAGRAVEVCHPVELLARQLPS
ncbi:(Fe-S)-binding protein [Imhoffiella purpurea]|uniref:Glycolate oxidase iron-sulfur subunit n=1 Tax=Imhoffiella purpurea TaxID=1249627 RepID=W9UYH9_9GAMM|nr:(Fe-S)-binding protein [Imhoffiella purpurea]EXJ12283.1 glycolate oxidase iron-sulfur subunit [Imhoffiella purpurea]